MSAVRPLLQHMFQFSIGDATARGDRGAHRDYASRVSILYWRCLFRFVQRCYIRRGRVSILYWRCGRFGSIPIIAEERGGFNSLLEMPSIRRPEIADRGAFKVSILYWRCWRSTPTSVSSWSQFQFSIGDASRRPARSSQGRARGCFNSLLEMRTIYEDKEHTKPVKSFNSLLEMRVVFHMRTPVALGFPVSILYWRCRSKTSG